jgi:hypothetical protein
MSNWEKPNFGDHDRKHFDFAKFSAFTDQLIQDEEEIRAAAQLEPYSPPKRPEAVVETPEILTREQKLERAASFMADLNLGAIPLPRAS